MVHCCPLVTDEPPERASLPRCIPGIAQRSVGPTEPKLLKVRPRGAARAFSSFSVTFSSCGHHHPAVGSQLHLHLRRSPCHIVHPCKFTQMLVRRHETERYHPTARVTAPSGVTSSFMAPPKITSLALPDPRSLLHWCQHHTEGAPRSLPQSIHKRASIPESAAA